MKIDYYTKVDEAWPSEVPKLTAQEAVSAGKRLYRKFMGRAFQGTVKATSGNRRGVSLWAGEMIVNPDRGWRGLVHSMSHRVFYRLEPGRRPHDPRHSGLEYRMVRYVVDSGWLQGTLRREPKPQPLVDLQRLRYDRVKARLAQWDAKAKRAQRAIKKLQQQARYYETALAAKAAKPAA